MRNAGHVVSKTMILSHVWDYNFDPQTNIVDVLVSRLREKIDRPFEQEAAADRARRRLCPPTPDDGRRRRVHADRSACGSRCGTRRCSSSASIAIVFLTYCLTAASLAQRDQQIINGEARRVRGRLPARRRRARSPPPCAPSSRPRPSGCSSASSIAAPRRSCSATPDGWDPSTLETGVGCRSPTARSCRSGRAPRRATTCSRASAPTLGLVTLLDRRHRADRRLARDAVGAASRSGG